MQNKRTDEPNMVKKAADALKHFFHYIKEELKADFKRSNIIGIPFFLTRGLEVNYFFIFPSVSTLGILMLIFVPLHRYPTAWVFQISVILILLSNIASLLAMLLWRWLVERHHKEMVEKRRQIHQRDSRILNTAARFASPFLTPEGSHPARHALGLWVKDNLLYIFPSILLVALFPSDILMLDPVMEEGISSILTYTILFAVMANLISLCAFILFFMMRWLFMLIRRVTRTLSGVSYLDR
ncbi:hypothetical protein FAI41_03545 [Acetobacteraceae bacterium]|nr:hypothetical protein FAI41_03545 [Acetobacteraceae bacterium]